MEWSTPGFKPRSVASSWRSLSSNLSGMGFSFLKESSLIPTIGFQPVAGIDYRKAHSTAKCNGEIFDVEENLTRSSVAEYLSGTRVEFVLDPLDIGIRHNREIGTFWEVLSE